MSKEASRRSIILTSIAALIVASVWIISCGGNSTTTTPPAVTGTITTSLTDPPVCASSFDNIWITITKVTANINGTASSTDSGWVTLVDLTANPKQIDLLSLASTTCLLSQLGSTTGLPPGNYQQIRIFLLDNNAATGPSPNNCGTGNGWNCVVPKGSTPQELLLSSEAQTGLKVPPGQIDGGAINLTAGQAADININFDGCHSIIRQGNGAYRLLPTLRAGMVSVNNNAINGKVVDSVTSAGIPGAVILLEQPDSNGIDRVVDAGTTASDGSFNFCPLTPGNYDVVIGASTTAGLVTTVYNATIAFNVPVGAALGNIPMVSEGSGTGPTIPWATLSGQVTTAGTTTGTATAADIMFSALQDATPAGATSPVHVTIPIFGVTGQPPTFETTATPNPATPVCPAGTDCLNYQLMVPASNPNVATYSNGSIGTFGPPAVGTVTYSLLMETTNCTASTPNPAEVTGIVVTPATTAAVATIPAFTGCTAPTI